MENKMNKFGLKRLLAVLAVAFACVCMWGCSDENIEELSSHDLIGYSGDSLVVYIERKYEESCLAKPLGDDCSTREKGTRIVVDNFYTEENVWKSDKLRDQYVVNVYDLVDDSTVIEFEKTKVTSTSGLWVRTPKTWVILSGMAVVRKKRLDPFVLGVMENGDLWGVLKIAATQSWMWQKRK